MKALLDLTDGQIEHLKEMLYDDSQTDAMNGLMSRAIYEELERAVSLAGIEEAVNKPRGHRWCGEPVQTTEKAVNSIEAISRKVRRPSTRSSHAASGMMMISATR